MPDSDLAAPVCPWRTSSYSNGDGECVAVSASPTHVAVRDSKDRSGPVLLYPRAAWLSFVSAGKNERFGVLGSYEAVASPMHRCGCGMNSTAGAVRIAGRCVPLPCVRGPPFTFHRKLGEEHLRFSIPIPSFREGSRNESDGVDLCNRCWDRSDRRSHW